MARKQLAHLVALALADHDLPPRVGTRGGRPHHLDRLRHHPPFIDDHAAAQSLDRRRVRDAGDLDQVLAQHAVPRVRHAQREVAVVGQDHQPLGVKVEAADRVQLVPHLLPHQVDDGDAPLGVVGRRHHPDRLVEQQVAPHGLGLQSLAVDLDRVAGEVGLIADPRDLAVDRDPAFGDQPLRVAARAHAGRGDQLLQAFTCH